MLKRKSFCVGLLVPLYLVTWVGGWTSYARQLQARTEAGYRRAERENQNEIAEARLTGMKPFLVELRKSGPTSRVWWSVPILPGALLAYSDSCVGPMYAEGGLKIVLYDGLGATELCTLFGWIA